MFEKINAPNMIESDFKEFQYLNLNIQWHIVLVK